MLVIIGWVVLMGAVLGSYVAGGGHIAALLQPYELLCIFGAAIGSFVVASPPKTLKATKKALPLCFKGGGYTKAKYLDLIGLLFELLQKARKDGWMALEGDIDNPESSPFFDKYKGVKNDHHLLEFIVDYMRMMIGGNLNANELSDLMDSELETHHKEMAIPMKAIRNVSEALPAFGIVAAVMGVVHTMGSVGAPPAILGEMIAGALVGTFLGILLAYGFVGPLATLLAAKADETAKPFECVKAVLLASMNGHPPTIAVEFGRKVLFSADRPSFLELEEAVKATKRS
jgi:chemotaxis protein MotA